jgi:hypothetical protein
MSPAQVSSVFDHRMSRASSSCVTAAEEHHRLVLGNLSLPSHFMSGTPSAHEEVLELLEPLEPLQISLHDESGQKNDLLP